MKLDVDKVAELLTDLKSGDIVVVTLVDSTGEHQTAVGKAMRECVSATGIDKVGILITSIDLNIKVLTPAERKILRAGLEAAEVRTR